MLTTLSTGSYQKQKRERAAALSPFNLHYLMPGKPRHKYIKPGQPSPVLRQQQMPLYREQQGRPTHGDPAQYWLSSVPRSGGCS